MKHNALQQSSHVLSRTHKVVRVYNQYIVTQKIEIAMFAETDKWEHSTSPTESRSFMLNSSRENPRTRIYQVVVLSRLRVKWEGHFLQKEEAE
jgi:hypothetical protein